jgi:hypothetical protein
MTCPNWSTARYRQTQRSQTFCGGLVHVPAIADPVSAEPGRVGQQRGEPLNPAVHGDVVNVDAALGE